MSPASTPHTAFRKKVSGLAWHYHKLCTQYPVRNFEEKEIQGDHDFVCICAVCKRLSRADATKARATRIA